MKFEEIKKAVDAGLTLQTPSLYTGFKKLGLHVSIRKHSYHLIGSNSGAGKSAFADNFYILNPIRWLMQERAKGNTDVKYKVYLWAMERKKEHRYAKWVCQRLFQKYGILMDVELLLTMNSQRNRMSQEVYDKFMELSQEIDEMGDMIEVFERDNPTGIYSRAKKVLLDNHGDLINSLDDQGKPIPLNDEGTIFKKEYKPRNEKEIVCIGGDHFQVLKGESRKGVSLTKKELVDTQDDYNITLRDRFGCMLFWVSQFNRESHAMSRRTGDIDLAPQESDFRDSSRPYDSCDVAIGMINPYKYQDYKHLGYDIHEFTSPFNGASRFRALYVLKNSFGADNIAFGNLFYGENGLYKELPKPSEIQDLQTFYNIVKTSKGL
jgi:hypothetical protein